jgi:hypothetical protein
VEALLSFALVYEFLSLACFPKPVLVCTFWLCTSLDVEAGLCNPLSKKKNLRRGTRQNIPWQKAGHTTNLGFPVVFEATMTI